MRFFQEMGEAKMLLREAWRMSRLPGMEALRRMPSPPTPLPGKTPVRRTRGSPWRKPAV